MRKKRYMDLNSNMTHILEDTIFEQKLIPFGISFDLVYLQETPIYFTQKLRSIRIIMGDFIDEYYTDKDLSLLKKLTLVIPTYNRNYYLSRCLWYHAHFPFGEIIVADSSPEKKKVVNRVTVQKIQEHFGTNIRYLEYEPETEKFGEDIYKKWASAVWQATTEYTKICTDKEFIIPEAIHTCILFLEEHMDYNTVDGLSLLLYTSPNDSERTTLESWRPYNKSYDADNPIERCRDAFRTRNDPLKGWNILTAVRRTKFQKEIYTELMNNSLNDIRFGDFYPQLLSILCSKRKYFTDIPYLVRDLSCLQNSMGNKILSESSYHRYPQLPECIREGLFDEKIPHLTSSVSGILENFHIYSSDEVSSYTREIVAGFLNVLGVADYRKQKLLYSSKRIYSLYAKIPPSFLCNCLKLIGIQKIPPSESKTSIPFPPENCLGLYPVEKLVKSTLSCHELDQPIPFISSMDRVL